MNFLQTIIIEGGKISQRREKISQILQSLCICPIDSTFIDKEKSIGIEDVRIVLPSFYISPRSSPGRAVIFYNFDKATPEAQNALLKSFEEPPPHTYMIAETQSVDQILPTLSSRSQVISLINQTPSPKDSQLKNLQILIQSKPGAKISFITDHIKTRQDALQFIDDSIISLRSGIVSSSLQIDKKGLASILSRFTKARNFTDGNVNFRLTLEVLLLGLKTPSKALD